MRESDSSLRMILVSIQQGVRDRAMPDNRANFVFAICRIGYYLSVSIPGEIWSTIRGYFKTALSEPATEKAND